MVVVNMVSGARLPGAAFLAQPVNTWRNLGRLLNLCVCFLICIMGIIVNLSQKIATNCTWKSAWLSGKCYRSVSCYHDLQGVLDWPTSQGFLEERAAPQ